MIDYSTTTTTTTMTCEYPTMIDRTITDHSVESVCHIYGMIDH